jgi:hypothetical protein
VVLQEIVVLQELAEHLVQVEVQVQVVIAVLQEQVE